jgi:hypothetical protein
VILRINLLLSFLGTPHARDPVLGSEAIAIPGIVKLRCIHSSQGELGMAYLQLRPRSWLAAKLGSKTCWSENMLVGAIARQ